MPSANTQPSMEIRNPRRILAIALHESQEHLGRTLKDLTGTSPAPLPGASGLAGTTHILGLATRYYEAEVPIWVDLVGEREKDGAEDRQTDTARQWADAFLGADAREVRAVLGAVVVVVDLGGEPTGEPMGEQRELVEQVGRLVRALGLEEEGGHEENDDGGDGLYAWDGVALVVGVVAPGTTPLPSVALLDAWEDVCAAVGLEFVGPAGPDEEGKGDLPLRETTGIPRVLEALQANDWTGGSMGEEFDYDDDEEDDKDDKDDLFGDFQGDLDATDLGFGLDRGDAARLREALWQGIGDDGGARADANRPRQMESTDGTDGDKDGDADPGNVEGLMQRLLAARELGAGLPLAQRRRLAARAVGDVMRGL